MRWCREGQRRGPPFGAGGARPRVERHAASVIVDQLHIEIVEITT
jgi:hypothetical protein